MLHLRAEQYSFGKHDSVAPSLGGFLVLLSHVCLTLSLAMLRPGRPVVQERVKAPSGSEVELRIRAVGLNFRDVLNVMGFLAEHIV